MFLSKFEFELAGLSKCVVEVGAHPAWASTGGVGCRAIAGGRTMTISPDLVYMRLDNTDHHHGTVRTIQNAAAQAVHGKGGVRQG